MDLISSNLQATNAKYNSILSKLESVKSDALSNLETAASTATSAISSQLANVTSELRSLVPEPTASDALETKLSKLNPPAVKADPKFVDILERRFADCVTSVTPLKLCS